jgi:tetratricopeptide (TPR) repeat protein
LKLPEHRIRSYVYTGVVTGGREVLAPHGRGAGQRLRFDFRDILVLKTARKLLSAGLPPQKVERALVALKNQLRANRHLSSLKLNIDGGQILVTDGEVRWEAESGQTRLDFADSFKPQVGDGGIPARDRLAEIVRAKKLGIGLAVQENPRRDADGWFNLGLDLETDDPDGAYEGYLRALACDPEHVEAMINLGRLCAESGDAARSSAYFRQAVRVKPDHPVAQFNLAVTLHDQKDHAAALEAYNTALKLDPRFADAHFNLATLLAEIGDHAGAEEHMQAYREVLAERQQ